MFTLNVYSKLFISLELCIKQMFRLLLEPLVDTYSNYVQILYHFCSKLI